MGVMVRFFLQKHLINVGKIKKQLAKSNMSWQYGCCNISLFGIPGFRATWPKKIKTLRLRDGWGCGEIPMGLRHPKSNNNNNNNNNQQETGVLVCVAANFACTLVEDYS